MAMNARESDPSPAPASEAAQEPPGGPEPVPGVAVTPPPRELGVMLVSAGLIGVVLPGPGVPALVAGGLILWPKGFGKAERWLRSRFPEAHRKGIGHINRFLTDLERRYPGSTGAGRIRILRAPLRRPPAVRMIGQIRPLPFHFNWCATCDIRSADATNPLNSTCVVGSCKRDPAPADRLMRRAVA